MRRGTVVKMLAGLAGAAAIVAVSVAAAAGSPQPADGHYEVPGQPPAAMPSEAAIHQRPDGTWESRLLPFAAPFPTREALEQALADARRAGLIK
jgi:hypothetical protein